ncbi:GvpL/GvpF family gas vesicle protein [Streptomyces sp. NPDC046805]|uniref:GvpL/GvpF family gas vesicle protein n=1 Tax=Streptomyces sp. NPDC046805 TaxID=3155134 RepID=UPI0033DC0BED
MEAPQAPEAHLSYAYGVIPSVSASDRALAEALSGVRGVAGAPVSLVRSGSLAAAVSAVPEEDFSEQALKVRLEDLEWLEAVARPHHAVIEALSAHTTVLPLRLATIYLDDAHVRDMLDGRAEDFAGLLDRLADHVELGVKVYAVPPRDLEEAVPAEAPRATSGRDYLQRRRQQRHTRDTTWRAARSAVSRVQAEAGRFAVDSAHYRPQQGRLAEGAVGENVANEAYLVPRSLADEFRAQVQRSVDDLQGVRVEVTGPWAPYSFAGRSA